MDHVLPTLIGLAGVSVAPWPLVALWRAWRSPAIAEAKATAAELERLMTEIARLQLDRADREQLVDLLRRELDKALVRGNATLTMARILLFAIDQDPKPSAAMIAARAQAQQVINAADNQINRGG